jgi:hypothetical protein
MEAGRQAQVLERGRKVTPAPEFLLVLPAIPPSANEIKSMHWAAYRDLRNDLAYLVRLSIGRVEVLHRDRLAHVTITAYSNAPKEAGGRARRLDRDNLWGGMKPLVDALRDQAVIKNDSDPWLDLGVCECRDQVASPRTEIAITYNGKEREITAIGDPPNCPCTLYPIIDKKRTRKSKRQIQLPTGADNKS